MISTLGELGFEPRSINHRALALPMHPAVHQEGTPFSEIAPQEGEARKIHPLSSNLFQTTAGVFEIQHSFRTR